MQIPLYSKNGKNGELFEGKLHSFGGPSPWEYVDANDGPVYGSTFTIKKINILFSPQGIIED